MKELGYGAGYNLLSKDESGLQYLPEELEDVNYFSDSSIWCTFAGHSIRAYDK